MKYFNPIPLKLLFFLALGIVIGRQMSFNIHMVIPITFMLFATALLLYLGDRNKRPQGISFGITAYLTLISIGIGSVSLRAPKVIPTHYAHLLDDGEEIPQKLVLKVTKVLKPSAYDLKYEARIVQMDDIATSGIVLLNVPKNNGQTLFIDRLYLTTTLPTTVPSPKNPGQFDYGSFLKNRDIHHQITFTARDIQPLGMANRSVWGLAASLRQIVNDHLIENRLDPEAIALTNALLMGQRDDITSETYESYAKAGAIHILAVSGLHVGIILVIINVLLYPLLFLPKGRWIRLGLSVLLLWVFAIIAGGSPSVLRAVTMFTGLALALQLRRVTNTYNVLIVSMFLLLLIYPNFLFEVGFQLSYAAVFAILWIQPTLEKLWMPKTIFAKRFWQLLTVTTAAQLGVLPISLYYFHQFPGLFFVSNLVILPFLGFILGLGLSVIFLSVSGILPHFLVQFYESIILWMNAFVGWVASQEYLLFNDIPYSLLMLGGSYMLIIAGIRFLKRPKYNRGVLFLLSVIVFQGVLLYEKHERKQLSEWGVLHKGRESILIHTEAGKALAYHSMGSEQAEKNYVLSNYMVSRGLWQCKKDSLKNSYSFDDTRLLVVDSFGVYKLPWTQKTQVLLRDSPKINLERLIATLQPTKVIADGSNYKSYVRRWRMTCERMEIPFYHTGTEGAVLSN